MADSVFDSFLKRQLEASALLGTNSDVVDVCPLPEPGGGTPARYIVRFKCKGVLRDHDGRIGTTESVFTIGISFREDHLRRVDPLRVVTWIAPVSIMHPNIRPPFVCVGHVFPGVELLDLVFSVYEMICYFNWATADALHGEAAEWARRHQHLFPVERRPLRHPKSQREAGNAGGEGGDA